MVSSICLKVINVDKKVLASFVKLKKRNVICFSLYTVPVLSIAILACFFEIIISIPFLILTVFLILLISLIAKIPNDVIVYNEEAEEVIIYGYGNLFKVSKPLVINRNDIISLGFHGKSPINKRKYDEHFYVQTERKIYILRFIDDFEQTYLNVLKVLPEEFFLQKYVMEDNFEKILSFKGKTFFMGFYDLMYKKIYREDLDEEQFELYIFAYFLFCLTGGGLHYFGLFFVKYLDIVMDVFNKLDMEECAIALSKLHYLYPQSSGKDFYEDYHEMYSSVENARNFAAKVSEVGETLAKELNEKDVIERFRLYVISKNIRF